MSAMPHCRHDDDATEPGRDRGADCRRHRRRRLRGALPRVRRQHGSHRRRSARIPALLRRILAFGVGLLGAFLLPLAFPSGSRLIALGVSLLVFVAILVVAGVLLFR